MLVDHVFDGLVYRTNEVMFTDKNNSNFTRSQHYWIYISQE
jgi:hypothetical protein